ncbi:13325_t:CDS:2, partial [Racocetra persica]
KTALTLWKQFGGRVTSAEILRTQMRLYKNREPSFKDKFIESVDNVRNWWNFCELQKNEDHICTLALRLNAIIPHNAVCERVFSILNWYMGKRHTKINISHLESMAQIHSYLVTNARNELKFVKSEISQDKLMQVFDKIAYAMIEECDIFDDKNENNYKEEEFANEKSNEEELSNTENGNISQLEIENFICLEHRMLNNNDDNISSNSDIINHGDPNFDIDTLLDKLE